MLDYVVFLVKGANMKRYILLAFFVLSCSKTENYVVCDALWNAKEDAVVSDDVGASERTDGQTMEEAFDSEPAGDMVELALDSQKEGASETSEDVGSDIFAGVPFGFENRGFQEMRGIVHAHSIYSHDGCSPDAPPLGSEASLQCLREMREAPCKSKINFIMQTDHPANVQDQTFLDALHYDESLGDTVIKDSQDRPFANKVLCQSGLVTHFYFFVGTEGGDHNMPVAMSGPIPAEVFSTGYGDSTLLESAQKARDMVHELGGAVFAAHSEEASISKERIVALPLDGMEIYNFHANAISALSQNLFSSLETLDAFIGNSKVLADLALLVMLEALPEDEEKFIYGSARVHLAHISANDVHRNVEVPVMCPDGLETPLCQNLVENGYPNVANLLVKGGPIILNDGDRLDSYARSYKWFANRALVKNDDPQEIRDAIRKGRSWTSFDLFGYVTGFDFFAMKGEDVFEMGDEVQTGDGISFYLRTPELIDPEWGMPKALDYSLAKLRIQVIRATLSGKEVLLDEQIRGGEQRTYKIDGLGAGAYFVKATIVPSHLKPLLQGQEGLADKEYPLLYSNAIFVRETSR